MSKSLDEIAAALRSAVVKGGETALMMQRGALTRQSKGGRDFATEADHRVQEEIVEALQQAIPGVPIVGEEDKQHDMSHERFFVLDPIDGTFIYEAGAAEWGVTAAYFEQGVPLLGIVAQPARGRLLWARRGAGCFLNDQRVMLSHDRPLVESVIGFSLGSWNSEAELEHICLPITHASLCVLTAGASVDGGMMLLSGVTATYFNICGKIWDFAAIALAVEEAGGIATKPDGTALEWNQLEMHTVFSASEDIHQAVVGYFGKHPEVWQQPELQQQSQQQLRQEPVEPGAAGGSSCSGELLE